MFVEHVFNSMHKLPNGNCDVSIVKKGNLETYLRKDTSLLNLSIRMNIVYFKTSSKISVVILIIFN